MVERSGRIWSTGEGNGKPPQYFCLENPMSSMIREKERTVKDELPRLKRSVFISIPKKGNSKECSNYHTIALISHASKVLLKIPQARLQQYVNGERPSVQSGLRKGRLTREYSQHPMNHRKSNRIPEKHILLLYWLCKIFDCVYNNKMWKILQEMEIPDHPTCLLRNLCSGQEATVRTGHGTQPGSK